jgi:polyvinyl alcohol dehydrogenase (cytochrome)
VSAPGNAALAVALLLFAVPTLPLRSSAGELLYGTEGNRLRRFDVDTIGNPKLLHAVFIERASPGGMSGPGSTEGGRDVNGMPCAFPDGSGRFVIGEDTGQPDVRPGWGIFDADANQVGKLAASYRANPGDDRVGEPFGCAFDSQGRLFTTSIGEAGLGADTGQLILWFPPYEVFPGGAGAYPNGLVSDNFCKIDATIGTASGIAVDADDNVYVAAPATFQVLKFAPPFPTGPDAAGHCGRLDPTGQPLADLDRANRSVFILGAFLETFTGLAFAKNGNLYVAQVLGGKIEEYGLEGLPGRDPLRTIVEPPPRAGTPQGIAVGNDGTLYYADLDIQGDLMPGDDGKFWRVRFDAKNNPLPPEPILTGLDFPDGVGLFSGDFQVDPEKEWRSYAGGPERHFHSDESILTPTNVGLLRERWRFGTGAIVTGSPAIALVDLPGEGPTQVVYFQAWDDTVYALRLADGSSVWTAATDLQPGAGFPNAASVHVENVGGQETVFIGAGEILYALDAISGAEIWRFTAGTGCVDGVGDPPGLCGFDDERNQIESSAIVAGDQVIFGMDVNDAPLGKGGFYAVDVHTGFLSWFFDLESGLTCTPLPGDDITHFDPYHSEAELGLPAGFRSRLGCDFPFSRNGCGNVWSSAAYDEARGAVFVASSNCDTDDDPATGEPPPPMPDFDEAIFSLDLDGAIRWRWRPREVDNDDLAFGAVPNLFTIRTPGGDRDVVGVGNKDGTYYVIDRDGLNLDTGVAWDDADASPLPYWSTNVVPGGALGGIIATASVDTAQRRILFGTAPGGNPLAPQQPTVHALDMDTGAVVWSAGSAAAAIDATFSPASSAPGVMFTGSVISSTLRVFETQADSGALRYARRQFQPPPPGFGDAIASGMVAINGTLLVGIGVGFRGPDPADLGDQVSRIPSPLIALCVPGAAGCDIPRWRLADLDYNRVVNDADQDLFLAALGFSSGDPEFFDLAGLDRDGVVTLADYQLWLDGRRRFEIAQACGLLGIEPVLLLAVWGVARHRRRGRRA